MHISNLIDTFGRYWKLYHDRVDCMLSRMTSRTPESAALEHVR